MARSTFPSQKCQKLRGVQTTFGRSDIVFACRRRALCTFSEKRAKREGFVAVSPTTNLQLQREYTTQHFITLHHTTLHPTTLHYTTLHYTTLQLQLQPQLQLQLQPQLQLQLQYD